MIKYLPVLMLLCSFQISALTVNYRKPSSYPNATFAFELSTLVLALDLTVEEYGPYTLSELPHLMNVARASRVAKSNSIENFVFITGYKESLAEELDYAAFPVDLGILGYRICFTHQHNLQALKRITRLDDLKKFSIGQGLHWSDVAVLRHSGLNVVEVPMFESLFGMVASKRIDLACRGINELGSDWELHRHMKGLAYDQSIALYYPLPRFFWANKRNKALIDRIELGLQKAYADGSIQEVWKAHFEENIEFANLAERRLFRLPNPNLDKLADSFEHYFLEP
ncbi:hypothetical protein SAMN02745866_02022 [Alteromonadaceae bacterium Bs31]|nr:hypothetical protein SAMN02745866_02022 [Alteromonadaceae bacterium Bs31]